MRRQPVSLVLRTAISVVVIMAALLAQNLLPEVLKALPLIFLGLAGSLAYRVGYEHGKRHFGVVWRKTPSPILTPAQQRLRAAALARTARQGKVVIKPTARDRNAT